MVSVVVPCFNYAHFLNQCIESLAHQSYDRWECIIVDDGSTDTTPQICSRLSRQDPRVKFLRQDNCGLSAARNAGIRLSRGEFVQLLDADDLLEPDKLKVQVEFLHDHADTDIVIGRAAFFTAGSRSEPRDWSSKRTIARPAAGQAGAVLAELVNENFFPVNAVLMRRSVLDSEDLFDQSLPAREDWDLWLRCALRGRRFAFVSAERDRALVRQHGGNMSAARQLMFTTAISVRERIHPLLPAQLRPRNAARLAQAKWRLGLDLMRIGKVKQGWRLYREGFRSAQRKWPALFLLPLAIPGVITVLRLGRRLFRDLL